MNLSVERLPGDSYTVSIIRLGRSLRPLSKTMKAAWFLAILACLRPIRAAAITGTHALYYLLLHCVSKVWRRLTVAFLGHAIRVLWLATCL